MAHHLVEEFKAVLGRKLLLSERLVHYSVEIVLREVGASEEVLVVVDLGLVVDLLSKCDAEQRKQQNCHIIDV